MRIIKIIIYIVNKVSPVLFLHACSILESEHSTLACNLGLNMGGVHVSGHSHQGRVRIQLSVSF